MPKGHSGGQSQTDPGIPVGLPYNSREGERMKLIGVDVDALAKRLSELRQEQSDIEAILRIARGQNENR